MELRKDYILDKWVIISEGREKRPHQFSEVKAENISLCYFCPGNEHMTPPEKYRVEENGKWKIRVFDNKFAAVSMDCGERECNPRIKTDNNYFTFADAVGIHEVIVETDDHNKQFWDLTERDIADALKTYSNRIEVLSNIPGIRYVNVFKNSGKEAGTSIVHTHSQVIATAFLPKLIREKLFAIKQRNFCPYCEILSIEKNSLRRCFENDNFVAFTPYASEFHYEIWVMPKQHINTITIFDEKKFNDLAEIIKKVLIKLKELNAPYNFFLHYNEDKDFHFMIEITPRLATWAGFEEGTGIVINSVSPESAAQFYRS